MIRVCCVLLAVLASCHRCENQIKIAATPVPHAEILRVIEPDLKKEGICLKILEVDDYALPNRLLAEKQVDANFFQHLPFLCVQKEQFGYKFEVLTPVHIEPLGIYSMHVEDLNEIVVGARVAIPSDPTNEGRALQLLEKAGLIQLQDTCNAYPSLLDIAENPYCLKIQEIDAAFLPRALQDVTYAVIPSNFALQGGVIPKYKALACESVESPYANLVVIREADKRQELQKLKEYLTSEKVSKFIQETYQGALVSVADAAQAGHE